MKPRPSGWRSKQDTPAARARAAEYRTPHYRATRRTVKARVDRGQAFCWRCGKQLIPGQWHLGHDDNDRTIIRGGECATCNLTAAAAKGARVATANRRRRITALRM